MRCQRSKNRCSYKLRIRWEDDMRKAGKCHGRAGVGLKKSSSPGTQSEQGDDEKEDDDDDDEEDDEDEEDNEEGGNEEEEEEEEEEEDLSKLTRTRHKDHHACHEKSMLILTPHSSHSPRRAVTSASTRSIATTYGYKNRYRHWKENKAHLLRIAPQELPWSIGIPDADDVCLSFYNSVMCAVAVTVDDEHNNPLRGTVMRMVFRSELAYCAVLMTSAQYLRSIDSRFKVLEIQVRQRVLAGLRASLARETWDWADVLVPIIFICSSAISQSCDATWVQHFACFQLFIKQMVRGHRTSSVPVLFISYFSAHLVLAKSLFPIDKALPVVNISPTSALPSSTEEPFWTSTAALSKAMNPDTLHHIDMWNGVSNSILLLINDILSLKDDVAALHQSPAFQAEQRTAIETKIATLQDSVHTIIQELPESLRQLPYSSETARRCRLLEYTSQSYSFAACLLLSEASTPAFLGYTSQADIGLSATQKQRHVDLMLTLIGAVVSTVDYLPISWPLWPLFIASCCGASDSDKARALALFHSAREKAPYENILRAQTVVELLWKRRKVGAQGERPRVGRFEWELALEFLGWQTSFA
ncbi:hypothetical protein BO70DRAFT_380404 [Aspergillus heteromorphus CBS 117.55]|uniref:Fungal-specific transcription factor domain-containing protein n=1 Tax=Aspergillus heteromorphus CBS 117.55 TaxID=1448321 RepID=A0A317W0W8_9EURO|nr:uncharacterized protein BO70DRAFT_380404 [Aspergillus heteromorphus CBS 117.55]PWY79241.1 hypothetical protein BO70DRAFT_380404 [Aspergillus heteromorphus CBS 117.55]